MKYIYIIALITSFTAASQTTLTEYNYLTKGYALDLETGRDIKKGYTINLINGFSSDIIVEKDTISRAVHLYSFNKEGEQKPVALLAKYIRLDNKHITYFCIPSDKSDIDVIKLAKTEYFKKHNVTEENSTRIHYSWNVLNLLGMAYLN